MSDKKLCKSCNTRPPLTEDHEHCSQCLALWYSENDVPEDLICDWDEPIGHQE